MNTMSHIDFCEELWFAVSNGLEVLEKFEEDKWIQADFEDGIDFRKEYKINYPYKLKEGDTIKDDITSKTIVEFRTYNTQVYVIYKNNFTGNYGICLESIFYVQFMDVIKKCLFNEGYLEIDPIVLSMKVGETKTISIKTDLDLKAQLSSNIIELDLTAGEIKATSDGEVFINITAEKEGYNSIHKTILVKVFK